MKNMLERKVQIEIKTGTLVLLLLVGLGLYFNIANTMYFVRDSVKALKPLMQEVHFSLSEASIEGGQK